jgi:hypothetical protein
MYVCALVHACMMSVVYRVRSMFRMVLTVNSDCFPNSINRLGFVAEIQYNVFSEVRTAHTVYLCVPYGSHNKQGFRPPPSPPS